MNPDEQRRWLVRFGLPEVENVSFVVAVSDVGLGGRQLTNVAGRLWILPGFLLGPVHTTTNRDNGDEDQHSRWLCSHDHFVPSFVKVTFRISEDDPSIMTQTGSSCWNCHESPQ